MGRSNSNKSMRCKKHPKHNQSIGVCPFCLKERLSHLSKLSSTSSSSSSSFLTFTMYSSSSSSSSAASPYSSDDSELSVDPHSPFYCEAKRSRWSLLLREAKREPPLTKSRSMAFAIGRRKKGEGKEKEKGVEKGKEKEEKKIKRFWFKLSGYIPKRGRDQEKCSLTHSKTLKEKPSAKWVLFA